MPVKIKITAGNVNDSTEACDMLAGIKAKKLLADKGYDTNDIVDFATNSGMEVVIPPKSNRIVQRDYDKETYKKRHLVENMFLFFKRWRGIATRYAKNTKMFLAAVQIRCISIWIGIRCKKTRVDTI